MAAGLGAMEVRSSTEMGAPVPRIWERETTDPEPTEAALCANIDETESAAIITEQGGQENHRGRNQGCSSFCDQLA